MTKYEEKRLKIMKENAEKLESLGISPLVASLKCNDSQRRKTSFNDNDKDREEEEYDPEKEDENESEDTLPEVHKI